VAHGPDGGTTGEPKIVPLTYNSLGRVEHRWQGLGPNIRDVNLIVGSIAHHLPLSKAFCSVMTMGTLVMLDSTTLAPSARLSSERRSLGDLGTDPIQRP
jgi:hypothetical protein